MRLVVGRIIKQHHRTAKLAWAHARRRWRLHTWQHILFSDESRFSLRFSDGRYRVYRRRGNRFTDQCVCVSPTVLEPEVLWSGMIFVMMVTLSSKFLKEFWMYIEHRTLVSFLLLTSIYDSNQHWKFNHVLRNNGNWPWLERWKHIYFSYIKAPYSTFVIACITSWYLKMIKNTKMRKNVKERQCLLHANKYIYQFVAKW